MEKIFVSIASYRDQQLIPTIKDLIKKSKSPDNLIIAICWQHGNDETLDEFKNDSRFKIIDIDYKDSRGACWARNKVQELYSGEKYYLQLDSHHRFIEGWDKILIEMLGGLKSRAAKPILTGYCTVLDIENDQKLNNQPLKIVGYETFSQDGNLMLKPHYVDDFKVLSEPIPARFISGHFIFTEGEWVKECRYDPDLYFHGEEISLSIRSYTHGYDLFHPHYSIVWHQYIRSGNKKHWDDHTKDNPWWNLDSKAKKRLRKLLQQEENEENLGKYALGNKRSFHDYELYTGIDFKNKKIGSRAKRGENPFIMTEEQWEKDFENKYNIILSWDPKEISSKNDCDFWFFGIEDVDNKLIFRNDFFPENNKEILDKKINRFNAIFDSTSNPHHFVIWPHSKKDGWLKKFTKNIH